MREILFRGKRIDNGEWVYGGYVKEDRDNSHLIFVNELGAINAGFKPKREDFILNYYEVMPETVGQDTGLKDKNGVKIFEGDILRDDESIVIVKFFVDGGVIADYRTIEGKWGGYGDLHDYLEDYKGEVIGNIHDNPEMVNARDI